MKGYYVHEGKKYFRSRYAIVYQCDHPVYLSCTLFLDDGLGLAVVQRRFNATQKVFWWGPVDPWIADDMYILESFSDVFLRLAKPADKQGIYPTITLRKLMYALGMKPIKKAYWEKEL